MRIHPLLVTPFLLPLAVYARQIFPCGCLDPRLLGQPFQKLLVALAAVPSHNRAQRRVGFQRRGIDADALPLQQAPIRQQSQHPEKHLPVRVDVDQPTRPEYQPGGSWNLILFLSDIRSSSP